MKHGFYNDYSEGAHPKILEALTRTNSTQESGYGLDQYSLAAGELIKKIIAQPNAHVHFVSAGTQANLIVLSSMLKSYESVIASDKAHIHFHEAGAVESTGHKINTIESGDGKINADQIQKIVQTHTNEHSVVPKVVFISQATELGTIYSKQELTELSNVCRKNELYLYLDGARLGSALTCATNDLDLETIASLVDAFYLGGTKNGALFGEAVVIVNPVLNDHFRFHLKQRGALLAKGRAIGAQFQELFVDGLFFDLAKHANTMAMQLAQGIQSLGYNFLTPPVTNQIFPIFPNEIIVKLKQDYGFYEWTVVDETHTTIRFVTSWATPSEIIPAFLDDLQLASRDR